MQVYNTNMYLEDIIFDICTRLDANLLKFNRHDLTVIQSFSNQISSGRSFTQKQESYARSILQRYQKQIASQLNLDFLNILSSARLKNPYRTITSEKYIALTQDNPRQIIIKFNYDFEILTSIREFRAKNELRNVLWNEEGKFWSFPLKESVLKWIIDNFSNKGFVFSEEIQNFQNQISEITNNLEKFVPVLKRNGNELEYVNFTPKITPKNTVNILSAILEARKNGIFVWDDEINLELEQLDNLSPEILKFLKHSDHSGIHFSENSSFFNLKPLLFLDYPLFFILPGGNEQKYLEFLVKYFTQHGIHESEMTVLFRLENKNDKNFNNFVKINGLNNAISEKIKIFFLSNKLPKPLLKSAIKPYIVFYGGLPGVNYSLANFLKFHDFRINFHITESDFALL